MKVKIGKEVFDGNNEPIMVILSEEDKENIKNMLPECTKYCSFPEGFNVEQIKIWMKI